MSLQLSAASTNSTEHFLNSHAGKLSQLGAVFSTLRKISCISCPCISVILDVEAKSFAR